MNIINSENNVTINASAGDDSIYNNWNFASNRPWPYNEGKNVVFKYALGDGNDVIYGFRADSTLDIGLETFASVKSGNDIIIRIGEEEITLSGAANLSTVNVTGIEDKRLNIDNSKNDVSIVVSLYDDIIRNYANNVTMIGNGGNDSIYIMENTSNIMALGSAGDDSIYNYGDSVTIDGGLGDDSIYNMRISEVTINAGADNDNISNIDGNFVSIKGGAGVDKITVSGGSRNTISGGTDDDLIYISPNETELLIKHNTGDGNDLITGFDDMATLNIVKTEFTSATAGNDLIITVGTDKITLEGSATLSNPQIVSGTHATFTIKNSAVTCDSDLPESVIKDAYQFNATKNLLTLNDKLKDYAVKVKAEDAAKVKWHYGTANLSSNSTLEYRLVDGENIATLTSKTYGDKITFDENATFNYGRIKAKVFGNGTISTKSDNAISFENNSSASVTAPRDYKIDVDSSNIMVNDLPVNAKSGAGTVTVERNGMSFSGYGTQFVDLEVAKESYFGKLAPMTVTYNSDDEIYTLYNTACVKTLSNDFTKLTFSFSGNNDEKYAYYKINGLAILTTKEKNDIIEVNGSKFKIQDTELDAAKIGRVTIDEQITFSGTETNFEGVKVNYAHNKPVIYSLDGKEIKISDAATLNDRR